MAERTKTSTLFTPELVTEIFDKVKDHSSIVKLCGQTAIPFSGLDLFTFNLDNEVSIVGEGEQKSAGGATLTKVTVTPIKVVYQHRVSNEFLYASEEKALAVLQVFAAGFAKKIASGIDLMVMHGVNPATLTASDKIGENHLDSVQSVAYTDGKPEEALTAAVELLGDYTSSGYILSKGFAADLGNYKEAGISQYPEFKLGANPGSLAGTACDVNTSVSKTEAKDLAFAGDFANAFRWGFAEQIPLETIEYGDPDGQGDLKRTNEIVLRSEAWIGWGILDKSAFARIVSA